MGRDVAKVPARFGYSCSVELSQRQSDLSLVGKYLSGLSRSVISSSIVEIQA